MNNPEKTLDAHVTAVTDNSQVARKLYDDTQSGPDTAKLQSKPIPQISDKGIVELPCTHLWFGDIYEN
jgi:hypothetical protein